MTVMGDMAKTIAVTNQKGGVGKTTTSVNLAASLAANDKRVLLIDFDPQGNASMGSGIDKNLVETSSYDVLIDSMSIEQAILKPDDVQFAVLASNVDLSGAEVHLLEKTDRELVLKKALTEVQTSFDYILIDCPPSLNMLTINALVAAESVLIPMQCEYYALEGLSALMDTINKIRATLNPHLVIEGLLRTMYDPRNKLSLQVTEQLHKYFGDKVYETVVPRNVRLAEAPSHGVPVLSYDNTSKGALAYLALAEELINKNQEIVEETISDVEAEIA